MYIHTLQITPSKTDGKFQTYICWTFSNIFLWCWSWFIWSFIWTLCHLFSDHSNVSESFPSIISLHCLYSVDVNSCTTILNTKLLTIKNMLNTNPGSNINPLVHYMSIMLFVVSFFILGKATFYIVSQQYLSFHFNQRSGSAFGI